MKQSSTRGETKKLVARRSEQGEGQSGTKSRSLLPARLLLLLLLALLLVAKLKLKRVRVIDPRSLARLSR